MKEHFGEIIYESGLYNKHGASLPRFDTFLNEMVHTHYSHTKQPSHVIPGESDHVISFFVNDRPYIIVFFYFPINDKPTYNLLFTTREQWNDYEYKLINCLKKGYLSDDDHNILDNILTKETKLNELFTLMKSLTFVASDFYEKKLKGESLSIGDTDNEKKINLYRNILENSFLDLQETTDYLGTHLYYIYSPTSVSPTLP